MTSNLHTLGKLLLAGLACVALGALAQGAKAPSAGAKAPPAGARAASGGAKSVRETLGAGDGVRITVFQSPDLTTEGRLSESGSVVMPLIGEVSLAGLTPAQAGHRVAEKLKSGRYILHPQVTVSLLQVRSRQVSVLGQVNHPGKYALEGKTARLTDILALAGGVAPGGADSVTITHANGKAGNTVDVAAMMRTGDSSKNVEIRNGDTIFVGRAPTFYIHGEVQRAGIYRLEPHMTVMQALAASGGITLRGTQRGMKIHRRNDQGNLQTLSAKLTDPVQPDDVIFVKESLF